MPIYEYYCEDCQHQYEAIRPASQMDEPSPCPKCSGPGKRKLSVFSFKNGPYGSFFKSGGPVGKPTTAERPAVSEPKESRQ